MKQFFPRSHFTGSGQSGRASLRGAWLSSGAQRIPALLRSELAARFSPVEWMLLAVLVVLPVALMWRFASPSYFFWDDIENLYWAHNSHLGWSYAFGEAIGHLSPAYRLTYLALDRVAPMNFGAALALLVACQAVSAVLLQRILTLVFGRAWWTYALALAWAVSVVYLAAFAWLAAGLHSIPAITATLASIHGYLCSRTTGRRAWLVWSLVAMCIGLAFYEKAVLIPVYLVLMRVLLLDPAARLRDSLESIRDEWRVWLVYATIVVVYLLVYWLGPYNRLQTGATAGLMSCSTCALSGSRASGRWYSGCGCPGMDRMTGTEQSLSLRNWPSSAWSPGVLSAVASRGARGLSCSWGWWPMR